MNTSVRHISGHRPLHGPISGSTRIVPNRICLPKSDGFHFIRWADIAWCEAQSNYCSIHMRNGAAHLVSRTLKQIHAVLPQSVFIRTHQSYVVNKTVVLELSTDGIRLPSGKVVPVSRSRRPQVVTDLQKGCSVL